MNDARKRRILIQQRANKANLYDTYVPAPDGWETAFVHVRPNSHVRVLVRNAIPGVSIPAWIKKVSQEGLHGLSSDPYLHDHVFIPADRINSISILDSTIPGLGEETEEQDEGLHSIEVGQL